MRTVKIYTRTGDGGNTGLRGGLRISKSHPRILAYGAVDEANAILGIVRSWQPDGDMSSIIDHIQGDLFILGADLSNPNLNDARDRVSMDMIRRLESHIDEIEAQLEPLANFVIPGGVHAASHMHHARTVVRRAETYAVLLAEESEINAGCITYLNRLSDLLFVMGRLINSRAGVPDVLWNPRDKL